MNERADKDLLPYFEKCNGTITVRCRPEEKRRWQRKFGARKVPQAIRKALATAMLSPNPPDTTERRYAGLTDYVTVSCTTTERALWLLAFGKRGTPKVARQYINQL